MEPCTGVKSKIFPLCINVRKEFYYVDSGILLASKVKTENVYTTTRFTNTTFYYYHYYFHYYYR